LRSTSCNSWSIGIDFLFGNHSCREKSVKRLPRFRLDREIRKLNEELDRRKVRRAMTENEIDRLLQKVATGKQRRGISPDERVLIYRLLLGTGLRSASSIFFKS